MRPQPLSPIPDFHEIKVQVQYPMVEHALEPMPIAQVPLFIYNLERDIFIRRPRVESDIAEVRLVGSLHHVIGRAVDFVKQVWVKNVEFVALDLLGRWRLQVIVRLIHFVPLVA